MLLEEKARKEAEMMDPWHNLTKKTFWGLSPPLPGTRLDRISTVFPHEQGAIPAGIVPRWSSPYQTERQKGVDQSSREAGNLSEVSKTRTVNRFDSPFYL